jgi:hypothetical protein
MRERVGEPVNTAVASRPRAPLAGTVSNHALARMLAREEAPAPAPVPADQRAAYDDAVARRIDPLPDAVKARLGTILGDADVYGKIVARDEKTKQRDKDLEAWRGGTHNGRNEYTDELLEKIKAATEEIKRLDGEVKAGLPALGVKDEDALLERVEQELPAMWVARGKEIAFAMLEQNSALATAESNRYVASQSTPDGSRPNATDLDGLKAADARLAPLFNDLQQTRLEMLPEPPAADGPGMKPQERDPKELAELQEKARVKRETLEKAWQAAGATYPVLLRPDYIPGTLASASDQQLEANTGLWLTKLHDNINKARAAIESEDVKVWELNTVPEMAYAGLGIGPASPLRKAIAHHIEGKTSIKELLGAAVAALAVGAGLIAAMAAGPVAGPAAFALASSAVSGAAGIVQLIEDVKAFEGLTAAGDVSLDPAMRDLAKGEPDVLALALDILALGLDGATAAGAARGMIGAVREARALRDAEAMEQMIARQNVIDAGRAGGLGSAAAEGVAAKALAGTGELTDAAIEAAALAQGQKARKRTLMTRFEEWLTNATYAGKLRKASQLLELVAGRIPQTAKEWVTTKQVRPLTLATAEELAKAGKLGGLTAEAAWQSWQGKRGIYHKPSGMILTAGGLGADEIAGVLIHEAEHRVQAVNGRELLTLAAEVQAHVAERDFYMIMYLTENGPMAGRKPPPQIAMLLSMSDEQLMSTLSEAYKASVPEPFRAAYEALPGMTVDKMVDQLFEDIAANFDKGLL